MIFALVGDLHDFSAMAGPCFQHLVGSQARDATCIPSKIATSTAYLLFRFWHSHRELEQGWTEQGLPCLTSNHSLRCWGIPGIFVVAPALSWLPQDVAAWQRRFEVRTLILRPEWAVLSHWWAPISILKEFVWITRAFPHTNGPCISYDFRGFPIPCTWLHCWVSY